MEITITRTALYNGVGRRRPFSWLYECDGPKGRQFSNTSIVELRRLLRRVYGRALVIIEDWDHQVTNVYRYVNSDGK